jgi:drug/metabolite transporter (DMT)-like permease
LPGVKPGRLKTTLVYFGLLEDPAERERLIGEPMGPLRWLAAVGSVVIAVAVVIAALALAGVSPTVADAAGLAAALLGAAAGTSIKRRRRRS